MKLLVHQPRLSYYLGGGEIVPLRQAEYLSQLGHDVTVLTSKPDKFSGLFLDFESENKQIEFVKLELAPEHKYIYDIEPGKNWSRWDLEAIYFGYASQTFYLDRGMEFDLVITHLLFDSLFVSPELKNVLHLHGVPEKYRSVDANLIKRPDNMIAVSEFVKKGWVELYPELKGKEIDVVHNGINFRRFPNKDIERDIDLLFVGRLIDHKGIYQIIRALETLEAKNVEWNSLYVIGKGPELKKLKKRVKRSSLDGKIFFKQDLSESDLVDYYNRSKVFLCPSYAYEGVLTSMLEAASCGCGIITTDACGMPEYAEEDFNALLVNPKDSRDLSRKIETLLKDAKLRNRLTSNGSRVLKKNWDVENKVRELVSYYSNYAR